MNVCQTYPCRRTAAGCAICDAPASILDSAPDDDCIIYPVNFPGGRFATLHLPRDLTQEEADKITRVVKALAQPNGSNQ